MGAGTEMSIGPLRKPQVMTDSDPPEPGWFEHEDSSVGEPGTGGVPRGRSEATRDWPAIAIEAEVVSDRESYYEMLHERTMTAARRAVERGERAGDRQAMHCVRAMDDCRRTANELAERVEEWAGGLVSNPGAGVEFARRVQDHPELPTALRTLAERVVALDRQVERLRTDVERLSRDAAPNLTALAGPVLAARLIALAGGLETLAKKPSGTLQVLGAESALFAHLRGDAPSPKHGVIYTHEAIRNTTASDRGSAARALAGKLTLAARVDHYSGTRKPELDAQLRDRIERIRSRATTAEAADE